MRIIIATGIFPPDIGGPATHSADLQEELSRRGHDITVLTLWDGARVDRKPGLVRFPRQWPLPVRFTAAVCWLLRNRRYYDVVYATGLHPEAVTGARMALRPVVVKVVGDPAWERARRLGLTEAGFEEFQRDPGIGLHIRTMCWLRNWSVRNAGAVIAPSEYLARTAERWLNGSADVRVIRNGVRVDYYEGSNRRTHNHELRAIYVGRLVSHKRLDVLLEAIARTDEVWLEVIGDGPERFALESFAHALGLRDRVRFAGALDHTQVLNSISNADVLVLASAYEGLPHVLIEALACGIPIVASAIGGIPEVVQDKVNGLIVNDVTPDGFASALALLRDDQVLRKHLGDKAREASEQWKFERCVQSIEGLLQQMIGRKPKVTFVGKGGAPHPISKDFERKAAILTCYLEPTTITVGKAGTRRIEKIRLIAFPVLRPPLLGGIFFYLLGPALAILTAVSRRRRAIVCQSPYEGFCVALFSRLLPKAIRPLVAVEVHGDWRTATRMYGSRSRRVLAPIADRIAEWTLRRADRVRVVSASLEGMVRRTGYAGEVDQFVAFSDFESFESPLAPWPAEPNVAFVGTLEYSKGLDLLLEAWAATARSIPYAKLILAGVGSMSEQLRHQIQLLNTQSSVQFLGSLTRSEVLALLDRSQLLVLPSRSEGLPRVILEAFARGRPVVATKVGGIPELVEHGRTGLLVSPEDPVALAGAIVEMLKDPKRLCAMGEEARKVFVARDPLAEFEAGIARLAGWIKASV